MIDTDIIAGRKCPYCGQPSQFIDSMEIYGNSYGMVYACRPCSAWVGVHAGTDKALGRLANAELREWKKKAHACFDPLWARKMKMGFSKKVARGLAYSWLASEMRIDRRYCHIGMFDVEQCKMVVAICQKYHHSTFYARP